MCVFFCFALSFCFRLNCLLSLFLVSELCCMCAAYVCCLFVCLVCVAAAAAATATGSAPVSEVRMGGGAFVAPLCLLVCDLKSDMFAVVCVCVSVLLYLGNSRRRCDGRGRRF